MSRLRLQPDCPIHDSFRVRQIAGMFDLPIESSSHQTFEAEVPDEDGPWQLGLIVGPSGSGKTTLARRAWPAAFHEPAPWPADRALIDCLGDHPIKQIVRTLTAVGFSSPPAWLKPHVVLSTGERFRAELARALLNPPQNHHRSQPLQTQVDTKIAPVPVYRPLLVFDEFTSVVDRTVAKVCSYAVSKAIRSNAIPIRFVAVTCHHDVHDWLAPDWVIEMPAGKLTQFSNQERLRRPPIRLRIRKASRALWPLFQRHHYLTHALHPSALCFVALFEDRPAAFTAVLPFPHPRRPGWREHRTVCLPDYQGIGIGSGLSDFVASLFVATGKPYFSTTSHPAMIHHRMRSPNWLTLRKPGMVSRSGRTSRDTTCMADTNSRGRVTASFEYVGMARPGEARKYGLGPDRDLQIAG
ncbi:MAG TPA: GNAT family N-acetyltransferase [Tepidisphaeraceae bacterium]|nr:GNAT family N-acetyltransferase [Tepidisphaeraceae bacterium]